MLVFRILILSTVALLKLKSLTVKAQNIELIRPFTVPPGINIRYLRYDSKTLFLFYCDVGTKTIHRYDPYNLTDQVLQLDQSPSFIFPIRDSQYTFLVGLDRDLVVLNWDYSAPNTNGTYSYFTCLLLTVQSLCHGNGWNTGRVDGYGNLWAGTQTSLDPPNCDCPPTLYRALTTKPGLLNADVAVDSFYANGIEFTIDYRVMYTGDYYNRQIFSFQFDLSKGIICCPQVVFRYDDFSLPGAPSSIVKDTDGNLWIGSLGGGQVINVNPNTGELLRIVTIPASLVTSVTFGPTDILPGSPLGSLLVGTARSDNSTLLEPLAGSVFVVSDLGVAGVKENEAVVNNFCKPAYFLLTKQKQVLLYIST